MSFLFRSSAKGIGRITNRLPLELADDVVGGAVDLLAPEERGGVFLGGGPSCVSFLGAVDLLAPEERGGVYVSLKALCFFFEAPSTCSRRTSTRARGTAAASLWRSWRGAGCCCLRGCRRCRSPEHPDLTP